MKSRQITPYYLWYLSSITTLLEVHLYNILNPCFSRINIRKFCPTIIGCYYWNDLPLSIHNFGIKKALYQYYFAHFIPLPLLREVYFFYPNYNSHLNKGIQLACYILPFSVSLPLIGLLYIHLCYFEMEKK